MRYPTALLWGASFYQEEGNSASFYFEVIGMQNKIEKHITYYTLTITECSMWSSGGDLYISRD
jgi:hypothetical protein